MELAIRNAPGRQSRPDVQNRRENTLTAHPEVSETPENSEGAKGPWSHPEILAEARADPWGPGSGVEAVHTDKKCQYPPLDRRQGEAEQADRVEMGAWVKAWSRGPFRECPTATGLERRASGSAALLSMKSSRIIREERAGGS